MKTINLFNALTMSMLYCLLASNFSVNAAPLQEIQGGAVVLIEPFASAPVAIQTQLEETNGQATQAFTVRIYDENGQLQFEITTQSLEISLPSTVQTKGSELMIFSVGYSATFNF